MTEPDWITLQAGSMRLRLSPYFGGAVIDWHHGETPIFRTLPDGALQARSARQLASFPLLPYSNRIADGRFTWRDRPWQLDHNFLPEPHTIHGVGWQSRWAVASSDGPEARLSLDYDPDQAGLFTWPFRLHAEQHFVLAPDGLTVTLSVRNTDTDPWPAGLGLHPHFPRGADLRLGFHAEQVWTRDPLSLPIALEAIPAEWRFDPAKPVTPPMLDNCFTGWNGKATLDYDDRRVTIDADPVFGHLIVYTPDDKPFCAVEPASHMPDAINRPGQPDLRVLAPGETLSGTVRFTVAMR